MNRWKGTAAAVFLSLEGVVVGFSDSFGFAMALSVEEAFRDGGSGRFVAGTDSCCLGEF